MAPFGSSAPLSVVSFRDLFSASRRYSGMYLPIRDAAIITKTTTAMTVTTTTTFRLGLEGNLEGTKSVVPAVEGFSAVFSCFGGRSFKGMSSFSEDAIYKFSEMGGSPSTVAMYGVVYFQYDHEAK